MLIISNIKQGYDLQEDDFHEWLLANTKSIKIQRIDSHDIWGFVSAHDDLNDLKNFIRNTGGGAYSYKITYEY